MSTTANTDNCQTIACGVICGYFKCCLSIWTTCIPENRVSSETINSQIDLFTFIIGFIYNRLTIQIQTINGIPNPTRLSCLHPYSHSTYPSTHEITAITHEMKRIRVLTTTAGIRELMQYLHFQLEQTDFHSLHVYSLLLSALSALNVIAMKLVSFSFVDVGIAELA